MVYITSDMISNAVLNMQAFNREIVELYKRHGMSLTENLGRRNNMLSQCQEHFIAEELRDKFRNVVTDGAPGRPDIFIEDINIELECKLTTRNVSGAIGLQIDYNTLSQKGALDCIYLIASKDFNSFAALFFKGLTTDDFAPPANGSRGRARMIKWKSMKKCYVLLGTVDNQKEIQIEKIKENISAIEKRLSKSKQTKRDVTTLKRLNDRKEYWVSSVDRYKINLVCV